MRLEIKQIPTPIRIPVQIKKTDSEVFRIQNDNGDNVLVVDSTDGSTGNTYFINLTPNGGTLEANGYQKIGLRAFFQLTGSGTQTALTRAFHGQMALKDSVSHSGTGANGAIGFFYSFVHDSTGTCSDGMGGYFQSTILSAGSSVNAGLADSVKGLRLRLGYGSAAGSGSCTEGFGLYIDDLAGVNATHTIDTVVGIRVPKCTGTGIINGYAIQTNGGDHALLGGMVFNRTPYAVSSSADRDDYIVGVTDTAAPRTITLPTAAVYEGKSYIVKDESGAAGANNITIDTQGAETIDGAASILISTNFGYAKVYSDGTNWFIIG